jgi:hypothetical protein
LSKLLGAIDDMLDMRYLAFVVGDEQSINANLRELPDGFIHMTLLGSKHEKRSLLNRFHFDGNILTLTM